jgi:hypothetical protein
MHDMSNECCPYGSDPSLHCSCDNAPEYGGSWGNRMENMHLFSRILISQEQAESVALALVRRSAWFSLEPLPDDEWEVQAKANEGLEKLVDSLT